MPNGPEEDGPRPAEVRLSRRLATIAFADVVAWSHRMAGDEEGAYAEWRHLRRDILEPRVRAHRGHLIKLIGDGALVEFRSALDAVSWAREVQDLAGAAQGLQLRIALHLCDVIDDEDDVWGDGVNVASRLQDHAPPGGVILSDAVHDIARVSIDLQARPLGPIRLRNMATPVVAWAIDPPGATGRDLPPAAAHGALATPPGRATRPGIAVLPLQDLSPGADEGWFAAGVVEDIVVSLAALRELTVIARGSTVALGAAEADPTSVGRTLGVDYVLMGTVRRARNRLRAAVQLWDARDGCCIWAESYRVDVGDLFEMQDSIVEQVVRGIAPHVQQAELRAALRRKPESVTAYEHALKGLAAIASLDRTAFEEARGHLETALSVDPHFAMAAAWLARWHMLRAGQGWSPDFAKDVDEAELYARRALAVEPRNALALATRGHVLSFLRHEAGEGLAWLDRARAACPNSHVAWQLCSAAHSYLGQGECAIAQAERGLRLSPQDRWLFHGTFFLGLAHYAAGHDEEALRWLRLSRSENPLYTANLRLLAATHVALGQTDAACAVVGDLLRREPGFTLSGYAAQRQPFQDPVLRERLLAALGAAGVPD